MIFQRIVDVIDEKIKESLSSPKNIFNKSFTVCFTDGLVPNSDRDFHAHVFWSYLTGLNVIVLENSYELFRVSPRYDPVFDHDTKMGFSTTSVACCLKVYITEKTKELYRHLLLTGKYIERSMYFDEEVELFTVDDGVITQNEYIPVQLDKTIEVLKIPRIPAVISQSFIDTRDCQEPNEDTGDNKVLMSSQSFIEHTARFEKIFMSMYARIFEVLRDNDKRMCLPNVWECGRHVEDGDDVSVFLEFSPSNGHELSMYDKKQLITRITHNSIYTAVDWALDPYTAGIQSELEYYDSCYYENQFEMCVSNIVDVYRNNSVKNVTEGKVGASRWVIRAGRFTNDSDDETSDDDTSDDEGRIDTGFVMRPNGDIVPGDNPRAEFYLDESGTIRRRDDPHATFGVTGSSAETDELDNATVAHELLELERELGIEYEADISSSESDDTSDYTSDDESDELNGRTLEDAERSLRQFEASLHGLHEELGSLSMGPTSSFGHERISVNNDPGCPQAREYYSDSDADTETFALEDDESNKNTYRQVEMFLENEDDAFWRNDNSIYRTFRTRGYVALATVMKQLDTMYAQAQYALTVMLLLEEKLNDSKLFKMRSNDDALLISVFNNRAAIHIHGRLIEKNLITGETTHAKVDTIFDQILMRWNPGSEEECVVCQNKGGFTTKCCGQRIHAKCVQKWSEACEKNHRELTCPMCRAVEYLA
jgi:hypothetical protein